MLQCAVMLDYTVILLTIFNFDVRTWELPLVFSTLHVCASASASASAKVDSELPQPVASYVGVKAVHGNGFLAIDAEQGRLDQHTGCKLDQQAEGHSM